MNRWLQTSGLKNGCLKPILSKQSHFTSEKNTKHNIVNCKNSEIKKAATEKEVTVQYKPGQILKLKTVPQVQLFFGFVCPTYLNSSEFKLEDIWTGGLGKDCWEQFSAGLHLWREKSALPLTDFQSAAGQIKLMQTFTASVTWCWNGTNMYSHSHVLLYINHSLSVKNTFVTRGENKFHTEKTRKKKRTQGKSHAACWEIKGVLNLNFYLPKLHLKLAPQVKMTFLRFGFRLERYIFYYEWGKN